MGDFVHRIPLGDLRYSCVPNRCGNLPAHVYLGRVFIRRCPSVHPYAGRRGNGND